MGEIFQREAAEHPEPFTGERLTAAIGGQVQIEHYHRYLFARTLVRGMDVLDVASGEGYGSALLAQVAQSVVGVEYSAATVRSAIANFDRPNLHFIQGDARALPLADASVDRVVSFETIEHFGRQDDFLREVRRVLRPGGCFVVSTPDRDVYSPLGSQANPYHVHELSRHEFVGLMRSNFRHVALLQQRTLHGSALLGETASPAPPLVIERRGDTHFEASTGLPRAPYLVAVASDQEPPPLPPSVYIDRSDLDTERVNAAALAARLEQAQTAHARLTRELTEATAHHERLRVELAETQAAGNRVSVERDQVRTERDQARTECDQAREAFAAVRTALGDTNARLAQTTERALIGDEALREAAGRQEELLIRFNQLRGSLRTFTRGYLPLLYRHVRGGRA